MFILCIFNGFFYTWRCKVLNLQCIFQVFLYKNTINLLTCKFWWRYFSLSASSRHLHDILITVIIVDTITTEWHLHTVTSLLWFTVRPEQHLRPTCLTELVSGFLQVSEPGWFNEGGERGRQQVTGSSALHLSSRSELWRAASRCEHVRMSDVWKCHRVRDAWRSDITGDL